MTPGLLRLRSLTTLVLSAFLSLAFVGCGTSFTAPAGISGPALEGVVHGGANPIQGGNVIIWETQSNGYGGTAKQLATAVTSATGSFSIDNVNHPYTCDPGQYAYITVTGGYTGSNSPNPASIQMAALGDCSHFDGIANQDIVHIGLSEVSTVAAGFALGRFITIDTSGAAGHQLVNVSAPASNNARSPGCTGSGAAMTCTANGLGHAFANAANLVDAVGFGVVPSGQVYTVPPSNLLGSVPTALLNAMGNIQQSCVNTIGGVAGDNSPCGKLFTYTTVGGVAPTDTLQTIINIARQPNTNVSKIFGLASPIGYFNPSLSQTPADFSIAIAYSGTSLSGTSTAFQYPSALALDAADNVYVLASDVSNANYSAVAGLSSTGGSLFFSAKSAEYTSPTAIATDTLGHAWMTNSGKAGSLASALVGYSTNDGSIALSQTTSSSPFAVAVDRANNLWFTSAWANQQDLFELNASSSYSPVSFTTTPVQAFPPYGVTIDANQNVWVADFTGQGITGATAVFANTGTAAAPAYGNPFVTSSLPNGDDHAYNVAIDASGNGWVVSQTELTEFAPTYTASVVTGLTPSTTPTALGNNPHASEVDGSGTFWSSNNGNGLFYFQPGLANSVKLTPCYVPAQAQNCAVGSANNMSLQIDSAGSVWLAAPGSHLVLQLIGVAAPTWPQLSYGKPGVLPQ